MVTPRTAQKLMRDQMLVKHYAGSLAYGTNLPTSDVDFRGVFAADPVNVRTPFFPMKEATDSAEEDTKLYELANFMKLCLLCNPNVIETLWVADESITFRTAAYDMLRAHRHSLLSRKVAFTTSGYALSQLKRIKGHNKWINNPQSEKAPRPYEYMTVVQWFGAEKNLKVNLADYHKNHRLVPYGNQLFGVVAVQGYDLWDCYGRLNDTMEDEDRSKFSTPIMLVKWNKEVYKTAKEKHDQYWQWKNNRNETRSELEEKFGYDTKHAMHLVRLLRMGVEALRDGEILVKRPDAEELLEIRAGAWTYEEIVAYAESMDKEVREVWYSKSELPKKAPIKFAAQLLMDVQDLVWSEGPTWSGA